MTQYIAKGLSSLVNNEIDFLQSLQIARELMETRKTDLLVLYQSLLTLSVNNPFPDLKELYDATLAEIKDRYNFIQENPPPWEIEKEKSYLDKIMVSH